jgi:hypothetical protein
VPPEYPAEKVFLQWLQMAKILAFLPFITFYISMKSIQSLYIFLHAPAPSTTLSSVGHNPNMVFWMESLASAYRFSSFSNFFSGRM